MRSAQEAAFYGTAAQVIPVLVLALAIELRFFDTANHPSSQAARTVTFVVNALGLLALLAGEYCALRVTADGSASELEARFVDLGLELGLLNLFAALAVGMVPAGGKWLFPMLAGLLVLLLVITTFTSLVPGGRGSFF